jgi:hypothetical protein
MMHLLSLSSAWHAYRDRFIALCHIQEHLASFYSYTFADDFFMCSGFLPFGRISILRRLLLDSQTKIYGQGV